MFGRLLLLFILVPLIELALFLTIGEKIGLPATLATIVVTGFLGAVLTKSQGGKALANFRNALSSGKMPHRELVDGLLILIAGAVLLTPGFLTDFVGFAILIPQVRAGVRGLLSSRLSSRVNVQFPGQAPNPEASPELRSESDNKGKVIDI